MDRVELASVWRSGQYKREYCDQLVEHMKNGFCFESFGAVVDVDRGMLDEWAKQFPEFAYAKERGFCYSLYFWEKIAIEAMLTSRGSKFNTALWVFYMKCRFKWTD